MRKADREIHLREAKRSRLHQRALDNERVTPFHICSEMACRLENRNANFIIERNGVIISFRCLMKQVCQ